MITYVLERNQIFQVHNLQFIQRFIHNFFTTKI